MATVASLFLNDMDYFALRFSASGHPIRAYEEDVEGFPPDNPILLRWDADKWDRGERECVGLTVLELSKITEWHIRDLDTFALPRVDVPTHGLYDVTVGDVLRWARQHQPIPTLAAGT